MDCRGVRISQPHFAQRSGTPTGVSGLTGAFGLTGTSGLTGALGPTGTSGWVSHSVPWNAGSRRAPIR